MVAVNFTEEYCSDIFSNFILYYRNQFLFSRLSEFEIDSGENIGLTEEKEMKRGWREAFGSFLFFLFLFFPNFFFFFCFSSTLRLSVILNNSQFILTCGDMTRA